MASAFGGIDVKNVVDEKVLEDLLDKLSLDQFDERKEVRNRLKELKEAARAERGARMAKFENAGQDSIARRQKEAIESKQRTLSQLDSLSKSAPVGVKKEHNLAAYRPVNLANPNTIKESLLRWARAKTKEYEIEITNFSSSWSSGIAFCALIHHFYPDAFDFKELDPKSRRKNFEIAFKTAEEKADIAPLLDVEDMVIMKNKPDPKCVFTYVQAMYRKLKDMD